MTRRMAPVLFVSVILLVAACTKAVPDETANMIIKDLAGELVRMADASHNARMEKVTAVCKAHGVEAKAFARYLAEHPDVEDRLVQQMSEVFKAEVDGLSRQHDKEIADLEAGSKAELEKIGKSFADSKREIEIAAAQKSGDLKKQFEEKRRKLIEELASLQGLP